MRMCPKCAAAAAAAMALGAVLPMFCNHTYGHDHLPEFEIRPGLTEPTVRAITTSGSMSFAGVSSSAATMHLTATNAPRS